MAEKKPYKVKVVVGDATIEVEGQESGVVSIVKALSDVLTSGVSQELLGAAPQALRAEVPEGQRGEITDIRSFFEQKSPNSHIEAAAVAAFYYQYLAPDNAKRETINAEQLSRAFRQAGWRLPKVIGQALRDAKTSGYLDPAGDPGTYRLNPVGYNLVEHTLGQTEPKISRKTRKKPKQQKTAARKSKSKR